MNIANPFNCRRLLETTVMLVLLMVYTFLMLSWITSVHPSSDNHQVPSVTPKPLGLDRDGWLEPESISSNEIDTLVHRYPMSYTFLWDIFISVKTTFQFHRSRLNIILDTWYKLARNEVG